MVNVGRGQGKLYILIMTLSLDLGKGLRDGLVPPLAQGQVVNGLPQPDLVWLPLHMQQAPEGPLAQTAPVCQSRCNSVSGC